MLIALPRVVRAANRVHGRFGVGVLGRGQEQLDVGLRQRQQGGVPAELVGAADGDRSSDIRGSFLERDLSVGQALSTERDAM